MGATYRRTGKRSWRIAVHWKGQREYQTVHSEADAKAICRFVAQHELAGVNVLDSIRAARTPAPTTTFPTLNVAIPEWIDRQVAAGELRYSSATNYKSRFKVWVEPLLGDRPVHTIRREDLGQVIEKIKAAGRGMTAIKHCLNPIRGYFRHAVETKVLAVNPASDLRVFIGRVGRRNKPALPVFTQDEAVKVLDAMPPQWQVFVMSGMWAGLRWGESAALYKSDLDVKRGRLTIQRTVTRGRRLEAPKNGKTRTVKISPRLVKALRAQIETADLEGSVKGWSAEQRQLLFPNTEGQVRHYASFVEHVWAPALKKAGVAYRKYHSTRHSYASWLLDSSADLRWVSHQLGHSSISITADVYGHLQADRHEHVVDRLDEALGRYWAL